MEQQLDVTSLVARADALLKGGQVREAAGDYARAVQGQPDAAAAHLGMAQAAFALGDTQTATAAAQHVVALAPETSDGIVAQALVLAISQRYEAALAELDRVVALDPARPYIHALRGYCLRSLGQRYEAALVDARAARLWGNRDFTHLFPPVAQAASEARPQRDPSAPGSEAAGRIAYSPQRARQNRMLVRLRFATNGAPVTFVVMGLCVAVYIFGALSSMALGFDPAIRYGAESGALIRLDPLQAYRIFTAMFVHVSLFHVAVNMISLFSVGVVVERIFGSSRFALLYFGSGIIGGVAQAVLAPSSFAAGASGAILGIFGAFGAFILLRRRALGPAAGSMISNWLFFLVLNIFITFAIPYIGVYDHVGGVISGFALGALLVLTARRRTAF